MADGTQRGFNFPHKALASQLRPGEIVVDFFAGGGGASEALRQALGRDPDVAVNHDHLAIGMHAANHPFARHMEADVWTVDILREVAGRPVGWFHASPDCTHFSQAKGGQPRDRATRYASEKGLARPSTASLPVFRFRPASGAGRWITFFARHHRVLSEPADSAETWFATLASNKNNLRTA